MPNIWLYNGLTGTNRGERIRKFTTTNDKGNLKVIL